MMEYCYSSSQAIGIVVGLMASLIIGLFLGYKISETRREE